MTEEVEFKEDGVFRIKESVEIRGITPDYVWYEAKKLNAAMQSWGANFSVLVQTMEARHKEHVRMLTALLDENKSLKKRLQEMQETPK